MQKPKLNEIDKVLLLFLGHLLCENIQLGTLHFPQLVGKLVMLARHQLFTWLPSRFFVVTFITSFSFFFLILILKHSKQPGRMQGHAWTWSRTRIFSSLQVVVRWHHDRYFLIYSDMIFTFAFVCFVPLERVAEFLFAQVGSWGEEDSILPNIEILTLLSLYNFKY